jgi:P63C domain
LVYKRLAPGVLKEPQRLTPKNEKGRRKNKLFQRLTEHIGHPRLRELLASEITLMRIFDDGQWDAFIKAVNKAIPIYGDLPLFDEIDGAYEGTNLLSV